MAIGVNLETTFYTHLFFVQEGGAITVPSAGTVSRTAKPGEGDPLWAAGYLGDVEEFRPAPESQVYDIMGGIPGGLVLKNKIEVEKRWKASFTTTRRDAITAQTMYGTLPLSASSTQGNPLEGKLNVKGWLQIQVYDADSNLRDVADVWGTLKVTSMEPVSGRNPVKVTYEFEVEYSTLNTIGFS